MASRAIRRRVIVPHADNMDDETFLLHLEKRHADECRFEKTPVARLAMEAWLPVYRTYHQRLHDIAAPGQHDHRHEAYDFDMPYRNQEDAE